MGYVDDMWRTLQADEPDTLALYINRTETARNFVRIAFRVASIAVEFKGASADQSGRISLAVAAKPASPRQLALITGTIEIKFGGATVRIDGLVDTLMLAAVPSHFHS